MIRYIRGDVTKPEETGGIRVIVHSCSDGGSWGVEGRSVAGDISRRWPEVRQEYEAQFQNGPGLRLGEIQLVDVEDKLWVANCVAQHGYRRPGNLQPFKYEAFEACMNSLVCSFASRNASIHMPKVGTNLGGADWHTVEHIIERTLVEAELNVTVYEL